MLGKHQTARNKEYPVPNSTVKRRREVKMNESYYKILEVAKDMMSRNGFHGTSLQMISEKVNLSKSTIIHHFKSKDGILIAILDERIHLTTTRLLVIADDKELNGFEKLKKFISFHLKELENHWPVMNLYLMESKYLDLKFRQFYRKSQSSYWKLVEQIIRQIQSEDEKAFRGLDPKVVAIGIIGMCTWTGLWYKKGGEHDISELADHYLKIIVESVGGGPRS